MAAPPSAQPPRAPTVPSRGGPAVAESAHDLLGELAQDLSELVRSDLELAAARRGPELRQAAGELAGAVAAGLAGLLALLALSWAAVEALALALPLWASWLVVAGLWLAVAALFAQGDRPRRLAERLAPEARERAIEAAVADRLATEAHLRETARLLVKETRREAFSAAGHAVEHEGELALKQLLELLSAPGRAGIDLVERVLGRA